MKMKLKDDKTPPIQPLPAAPCSLLEEDLRQVATKYMAQVTGTVASTCLSNHDRELMRSRLAAAIACLEELQLIPGGQGLLSGLAAPSEIQLILQPLRDKLMHDHRLRIDEFRGSLGMLGTICNGDILPDSGFQTSGKCEQYDDSCNAVGNFKAND